MPRQFPKRYPIMLLILLIGSLVFPPFALSQQEVLSLAEALQNGQVTVVIRGIADDPIFIEPMLEMSLTNETANQLSVTVPNGLTLRSEQGYADLLILNTESASIDLNPNQSSPTIQVIAYSLAYDKPFPDSQADYQLEESINISPEVRTILDNIIAIGSENELSSQLAVWLAYHELTLEQFDQMFEQDFSVHRDRINQIQSSSIDSWPLWVWVLLVVGVGATIFFIILKIAALLRDKYRQKYWLDYVAEDDWQLLAEGGMAKVYIVPNRRYQPAQEVVIKLPKWPQDDSEQEKNIEYRFKTEGRLHQKLKHRSIVKFLGAGECRAPDSKQKIRYLAQEFVDGETIQELLDKQPDKKLKESEIIEIMTQILDAVEYIHNQKIVHRDLTLTNIMIDKQGVVKIIDFGTATNFDSNKTKELKFDPFGNPPFYAPSHIIGSAVPARDFYSLAVLLFAMHGGHVNYYERDPDKARERLLKGIKNLLDIPVWLSHVLCRGLQIQEANQECTTKTPYQNASEFRKDLPLPRNQLARIVQKTGPLNRK